jgi:hypothetical protein
MNRAARSRHGVAAALLAVTLTAAACAGTSANTGARPNTSRPSEVLVSIGGVEASESAFAGGAQQLWSQIFYQRDFGTGATFYDFSAPGADLSQVLSQQLPSALSVKATIVTVWASLDDILNGTEPATYESELGQILRRLVARHVTVLVANTPPVELYPSYAKCFTKPASCGSNAAELPTPAEVGAIVAAYNRAITTAVRADGGIVVDVNALLTQAVHRGGVEAPFSQVSFGSRHRTTTYETVLTPSGAQLVADAFAAALPKRLER